MVEPPAWLSEAERRLLESYLRIGCSQREALLAVAGDLLQRSAGPGADVDDERVQRYLRDTGLTVEEVHEAVGLRLA